MERTPIDSDQQGRLMHQNASGVLIPGTVFPDRPREKMLGTPNHETVYAGEGTYVDVIDRAQYITETLELISTGNQRIGFAIGSTDTRYSGQIYERYRGDTPRVKRGAENNLQRLQGEAMVRFRRVTGLAALRGKGLASETSLRARARSEWIKFYSEYGGIGDEAVKKRNDYKKRLMLGATALEAQLPQNVEPQVA